jgi:hypothetical protein
MLFQIPSNLEDLTPDAVARMRAQAAAEFNENLGLAQAAGEVTDEQLDRMEALRTFVSAADGILLPADGPQPEGADGDNVANRLDQLSPLDPEAGSQPITPTVADVAAQPLVSAQAQAIVDSTLARASITASAGLPGYSSGQVIDGIEALAVAATARIDGYVGVTGGVAKDAIATVTLPKMTDFSVHGDRRDVGAIEAAVDESRLSGGSLVAARTAAFAKTGSLESVTASGWCAPSEIDYSVQFYGSATGLYDLPTVTASRGGLWVMPELAYSNIYGTVPAPGANYFSFTEAQVIAGSVKHFVEIDCPTPHEYRLGVTGFGAVAGLLELRAYPEYVREYIRASLIGLQHFRAALNIAAVVAGSTAVALAGVTPWIQDGSVVSQVLSAAEMAAVDQRYAARLSPNATIEQVFPLWLLAQFRADWIRRNAAPDPNMADAWIMNWFSQRNIAPQFVYDWQDAYGSQGGATFPGSAAPTVTQLPTTLYFLSYPAGTWVNAVADVITLSSVYDSVRLASNTKIELFTEQGNIVIPRRADSRVYSICICPNGSTGHQRQVACNR